MMKINGVGEKKRQREGGGIMERESGKTGVDEVFLTWDYHIVLSGLFSVEKFSTITLIFDKICFNIFFFLN